MLRLVCLLLICSYLSSAQTSTAPLESKRWIIKLDDRNFSKIKSQKTTQELELNILSENFNLVGVVSNEVLSAVQVESRLAAIDMLNIYPDRKLNYRDLTPDDFSYPSQWNMDIIDMPSVWEHAVGGSTYNGEEIVIAVLDVGYEIDHIDLVPNFWTNNNEIANDGIDNDNNGYKDDYNGLNIDTQNDSHNIDDHGTKVAGIIGAEGNNGRGVAGVNWKVKLLPIGGVDFIGEIIVAMEYVIMMKKLYNDTNGAKGANILVTNLSAGVGNLFPIDSPDWCPYYDLAGELGILSVGSAPNLPYDVEKEGDLPSLCSSDFLITVTNTDQSDLKLAGAGWGKVSIDMGAPGERVFTTSLNDDYGTISGTSGSAPHVAGIIGLLYSLECEEFAELTQTDPPAAAQLIKSAIMEGVDKKPSLGLTVSEGRLNAYKAFLNIATWCTGTSIGELELTEIQTRAGIATLSYNTDDFSEHKITLFNILGQKLKVETFRPPVFNERVLELDISSLKLETGSYIFTISNENSKTSKTFGLIR